MAAKEVVEVKEKLQFHPCITPRGLLWYDLSILTAFQQKQINEKKLDVIKEDLKYLAAHPEVRAIIGIFVREVFRKLPLTVSIAQFARRFFAQEQDILETLIRHYMLDIGEPIKREGDSAVNIKVEEKTQVEFVDDFLQPPYYCYLAYRDELSEEMEEEEEEMSYGTYTYSSDSFTTTAASTSKFDEFNKKYSRVIASRSTVTDPTVLRVTPAGSDLENFYETYEMEDMDLLEATIMLTQQAIGDESNVKDFGG